MKRETIALKHGRMDVLRDGDLIYVTVHGNYTDDDLEVATEYVNAFLAEVGRPCIRVWDATNMTADQFQLSPEGISRLSLWAENVKKRWPSSSAYMIGADPLVFGMSRMYELRAGDEQMSVGVLHSFDELPEKIKSRIRDADAQLRGGASPAGGTVEERGSPDEGPVAGERAT